MPHSITQNFTFILLLLTSTITTSNRPHQPKRLAIITGGTRGIGRGIAQSLAKTHSSLLLTYNSNIDAARAFASELRRNETHLDRVEIVGGDLSSSKTRDDIFKCVDETFGDCELATMVHNAGQYVGITAENEEGLEYKSRLFGDGSLLNDNDKGADLQMMHYYQRLYGDAYVDLCERSLVRMKKAKSLRDGYRGSLIGISSPGCNFNQRPTLGYDMPGSGKCIMEYAMRLFALRAAEFGVNCNVVIPGFTVSDAWGKLAASRGKTREEFMEIFKTMIPMGCLIGADDIADIVRFLCDPNAGGRLITGVSLSVDGGRHLGEKSSR